MSVKADVLFAVVPEWLIYADVGPQAVRLYAALARHADKDTGHAHPSRRRLAELLRCSADTVDRALRELIDAGAISMAPRRIEGTNERTTNDYCVHVTPPRSRTDAATPDRTDAATGSRTDAAVNKSQDERESSELDTPVRAPRPRDVIGDALAMAEMSDPLEVPASRMRTLCVKANELRKIDPDVTPAEVARRAANWSTHFEGASITGPAIVTHWARLAHSGINGRGSGAARTHALAEQLRERGQ